MAELHQQIKSAIDFGTPVPEIPQYISNNLKYVFFDWQKEAFEYFLLNENRKKSENNPTHLLFNMATGTGKTLVMAAAMLYYYKQGYKHFLFFVNQNNIVDKTENNFIDTNHTKYLFKDKIIIDDKTVKITKVENFSDNPQGIEIKFTTIQKLYNDIHLQRENQTTLDDLHSKNIVMLADEAHHLNSITNNNQYTQTELELELKDYSNIKEIERKGWEHTVIDLILKKNGNYIKNTNVLLEFTATPPNKPQAKDKYKDKIIYKFGLKEFLQAGYTKEINLIYSNLNNKERILQALLFNWYRHKIALKHNIHNFKPVILFRSSSIIKSEEHFDYFKDIINKLSMQDFEFLNNIENKFNYNSNLIYEQGKSRTIQVFNYIQENDPDYSSIINFIKDNFSDDKLIITNSKEKSAKGKKGGEKTTDSQDQLLNSLEDKNNHIRAIFTVKRLTEGWDVLNLFDIIKLDDDNDNINQNVNDLQNSTTAEQQLIGRGVRYFPFNYNDEIKNKRKFDINPNHELRILEELYFYSTSDSNYINELKYKLITDGFIKEDRQKREFKLKDGFLEKDFYKRSHILYNYQKDNPDRKKKELNSILKDFTYTCTIKETQITEENIYTNESQDITTSNRTTYTKYLKDFERHIFLKAINIKSSQDDAFFTFESLKNNLCINSIDDLLKPEFFGGLALNITIENIT
ncbi:MAG: DEAD/DEAH box helicase family protein, partial [Endomicrobiaceae bacterium]